MGALERSIPQPGSHRMVKRLGAADRPCRALKGGEKSVASSSEHAGHVSVGAVPGLDPAGSTRFVSHYSEYGEECPNDQVVLFLDALRAAQEFLATERLPRCITWLELR
jgi:hypothetical protein